ncbi:MAG: EF-P lysine aminoacylase GenX, partial [Rhodobacteraceae bacterium]|nr:EF-P lysine aminoacylase GenX [Paracoccaceae bacterium]
MTSRPDAPTRWWRPHVHADRRPLLLTRNRIQAALRGWLAGEGFTEVDTAALQVSPGNEAHLHGFETRAIGNDGQARPMYLHTSPEFAMKKLLAAGEMRIASFAHVWRNRERGALHSPEFTMLEWYRVGEDYTVLMEDCAAFLRLAAKAAGTGVLRYRDQICDPFATPERLSVAAAFARHAGIDLLSSCGANGTTDAVHLRRECQRAGVRVAADDGWSDMLSRVLVERVEPHLGHG